MNARPLRFGRFSLKGRRRLTCPAAGQANGLGSWPPRARPTCASAELWTAAESPSVLGSVELQFVSLVAAGAGAVWANAGDGTISRIDSQATWSRAPSQWASVLKALP